MRHSLQPVVPFRVQFGRVEKPTYDGDKIVDLAPVGGFLRLTQHTLTELRELSRTRRGRQYLRRRAYLRKRGATLG